MNGYSTVPIPDITKRITKRIDWVSYSLLWVSSSGCHLALHAASRAADIHVWATCMVLAWQSGVVAVQLEQLADRH